MHFSSKRYSHFFYGGRLVVILIHCNTASILMKEVVSKGFIWGNMEPLQVGIDTHSCFIKVIDGAIK